MLNHPHLKQLISESADVRHFETSLRSRQGKLHTGTSQAIGIYHVGGNLILGAEKLRGWVYVKAEKTTRMGILF